MRAAGPLKRNMGFVNTSTSALPVKFILNLEGYEGNWQNGSKEGADQYTYTDGTRYNGHFFNGKKHGKG